MATLFSTLQWQIILLFLVLMTFTVTCSSSSVKMSMDTAQVNFVNNYTSNVSDVIYVWTHYKECYKCPYMPKPLVLKFNETKEKQFTTDYTLKYAITTGNRSNLGVICNGFVSALDQSIHEIIINSTTKTCPSKVIKEGRNNIWPLLGAMITILMLANVFYGGKHLYTLRKRHPETIVSEENQALRKKLSQRLNCLDAFRGLTIVMMIFCNWGGGGYHFIHHVEWDGLHIADVIFPFFIFIMGATMAIGLRNQVIKKNLPLSQIYKRIAIRSAKLFFFGLVVNSGDITKIRILGVLQRFSLSYMIVACTHVFSLHINRDNLVQGNRVGTTPSWNFDFLPFYWPEWTLVVVMMSIYFPVTYLWHFDPACPVGYLGVGGFSENASYPYCIGGAANKLDRLLFTKAHIYPTLLVGDELYDPEVAPGVKMFGIQNDCEGVLGYTTSILLTVLGLQAGKIMVNFSDAKSRLIRLVMWSAVCATFTTALAVPGWVPVNKNLWSFTFVTANGTLAFAIFSLMYLLIDHWKIWPLGHPLHYPGMNAIFLYIGHNLTYGLFPFFFTDDDSSHVWPLVQVIHGVFLWILISVFAAKRQFFVTL